MSTRSVTVDNVDPAALKVQIVLLSALLEHLTDEQYELAVGGVQLLEEIAKQVTDEAPSTPTE